MPEKKTKSALASARDAYTKQICKDKCKCKKRSKREGTGGTMAKVAKELGRRWRLLNPKGSDYKEGGSEAQNEFKTVKRTAWEKASPDNKKQYLVKGKKEGQMRPPLDKFMEFSMRNRKDVTAFINKQTAAAAPPSAASAAPSAASAAPSGSVSHPITGTGAWRKAKTASMEQGGATVYYQNKNGELKSFPQKK